MARFCTKCGRPLKEGEVCNCTAQNAGGAQNAPARPGTDVAVNMDGFISVTPMRADLTCHVSLREMENLFDDSPRAESR